MSKTKIIVGGIGGVGGFFGGLLAKHYQRSDKVEIIFLARGSHLEAIQKNGLRVKKGAEAFTAIPALATDDPIKAGIADFILLCTKSYDLESTIQQLGPSIGPKTVILPLLNGVDSRTRILALLPETHVLHGCVYIVSRLTAPGHIENIGNIQTLYFGLDGRIDLKSSVLEKTLADAGIEAKCTSAISDIIWEKYTFISPTAAATTYFDSCIGELLADEHKKRILELLIAEVQGIATAKNINLPQDIVGKTIEKLQKLPFDMTSSMHHDFQQHKEKNELDTLCTYVVSDAQKHQLPCPTFQMVLSKLSNNSISKN
ncbi:MAG: ketopantoate reductase family protein [Saprospiraceae bacterium]